MDGNKKSINMIIWNTFGSFVTKSLTYIFLNVSLMEETYNATSRMIDSSVFQHEPLGLLMIILRQMYRIKNNNLSIRIDIKYNIY